VEIAVAKHETIKRVLEKWPQSHLLSVKDLWDILEQAERIEAKQRYESYKAERDASNEACNPNQ
jgi:hypothetical protein